MAAEKQTKDFVEFYEPRTGDKHEATVYQQLKKWALRDDWREKGSIKAGTAPRKTCSRRRRRKRKLALW